MAHMDPVCARRNPHLDRIPWPAEVLLNLAHVLASTGHPEDLSAAVVCAFASCETALELYGAVLRVHHPLTCSPPLEHVHREDDLDSARARSFCLDAIRTSAAMQCLREVWCMRERVVYHREVPTSADAQRTVEAALSFATSAKEALWGLSGAEEAPP